MSISRNTYWGLQLEDLAAEMSRLCLICDIQMLESGVFPRILQGDESVCGRKNTEVFRKLRRHLVLFYHVEERAIRRLGDEEVEIMLDEVLATLEVGS